MPEPTPSPFAPPDSLKSNMVVPAAKTPPAVLSSPVVPSSPRNIRLRFHATPEMPTFVFAIPAIAQVPHGKGTTMKVLPARTLVEGDYVDMDKFESEWSLSCYPLNFKAVSQRKGTPESEETLPKR